ncbi:hypothetical protein EXIGLDRAFT_833036 [Exidia glandulosa HHB12029]|uniref:F-box domain-containing protein n=1 Tax=Exidia glandulosa HHB12029 TaxID=1314781 RepID=A0A165L0Y3_EXIGL|nr:hypothetical protein EXIGLDRAFT_833036 [Exidia glandulosa HHB12029]
MGQYWVVLNLSKRQSWFIGKLEEQIFSMRLPRFFGRRFRLLPASSMPNKLGHEIHTQEQSILVKCLPSELIIGIFESCDEYRTAACLALTCRLFWDLGRSTVERQLNDATDWTGDRLACIGDYAAETTDDLPKGMLDDSERALIDEYVRRGADVFTALRKLCPFAVPLKPDSNLPVTPRNVGRLNKNQKRDDLRADTSIWRTLVEEVSNGRMSPKGMVLRDLTARQYVRGDAFIEMCEGDPDLSTWREEWDLADLIILGICCSGDPSGLKSAHQTSLQDGLWSGHRFDVVEEKILANEKWKDVSRKMLNVAQLLFEIDGEF